MWISSFVVTLPSAEESAEAVLRALAAIPVFTLGERQGSRLPVVVEASDGSTSRYWHEWVEQLPGVVQVEVAFVSFDESERQPELVNDCH
jgi:nitrate reductase NapAB chaperone NapD